MVKSAVIDGLEVREVCVEADIGNGLPVFHMVGYLSSEVKEAGERVRTAIRHTKVRLQPQRMVVNLSPADIRKKHTTYHMYCTGIGKYREQVPKQGIDDWGAQSGR